MKRLLALAALVLLLGLGTAYAQETETISPALAEHLDAIEQVTSRLRGLEALTPVERRFPSREDVIHYLEREFSITLDDETLRRETQFYIAFDLLPPDVDLMAVYLAFLSSPAGVAGFYDTDSKTMNVLLIGGRALGDRLPMLDQVTYAHEYTHALQDQHFDLETLLETMDTAAEPDRALAVLALVEGDATAVMTDYLQVVAQNNPLAAAAMLLQGFSAGAFSIPDGTPPFIVTELTFSYEQGQVFVSALRRQGGWEAVNRAYEQLPESTEQIIHPQKYLDGERPLPVTLATVPPGPGWELLADRTLGEFYLREYLSTQLRAGQARQAAAGWGGDRYHLYHQPETDQRAWALRLLWDTPADATEFTEAFAAFAAARFDDAPPDAGCWSDAVDALCFVERGGESWAAYAPQAELARALLGQ